jgi:LysM repeat protein
MKKLLILVVVAALVGIVMSKSQGGDVAAPGSAGPGSEVTGTGGPPAPPPEAVAAGAPADTGRAAVPTAADKPVFAPAVKQASPGPQAERSVADRGRSVPPARPSALLSQVTPTVASRPAVAAPAPAVQPVQPLGQAFGLQVERAGQLLASGKRVEARALLSKLYVDSRGEAAVKLRSLLDRINAELVFTPRCVDGAIVHVVEPGDVGVKVAKKYGVSWGMIKRLNGMQSDNLSIGQRLKIIQGPATVLACKSEFRLALFMNGVYVKEYPIGIGRDDLTPTGVYEVDSMLEHPRWYPPGGGFIEYGEEGNPLGERWVGFRDEPGANGIGIHGTNDEGSIGTKCSNGCLRMKNADVTELYDFLSIGCKVQIIE